MMETYLIEALPYLAYLKDISLTYRCCSPSFTALVGVEGNHIAGNYLLANQQYDEQVLRTNKPILKLVQTIQLTNGQHHTVITDKLPIHDNQGILIGILSISKERNNDVTSLLGDIYGDEGNEELVLTRKELAHIANETKATFIANMSHDLRTPLSGILGLTQSIMNRSQETSIRNDASLVANSTQELLNLLNEIIHIIKVDSGEGEFTTEIFDLRQLIEHNSNLLRPTAHHKNITINCDISSLPQLLQGKRTCLDRIILNLLGNAVKFTRHGSITISANVISHTDTEVTVRITVEDTGPGIPSEKFATIFDYFSRLSPSYEGIHKGQGLGLAVVKRYVNSMGGQVSVTSKLGHGSCFTVTVPLLLCENTALPISEPTQAFTPLLDVPNHPQQNYPIKLLLIEDSQLAAFAAEVIFQTFDCQVTIAPDGKSALELIINNEYDLIVTDIGLPDISGIQIAEKIRSLPDKQHLPIVALTGHTDSDTINRSHRAGISSVFTKPLNPSLANELISRCRGHVTYTDL